MQSLLGMKFDFSLKGYINLVVFISIVILDFYNSLFYGREQKHRYYEKLVVILKLLNKSVSVYVYYSNGGTKFPFLKQVIQNQNIN